jgi:uncharacterized protein DUF6476
MARALDDESDAAERRVVRKLRRMMIGSSLVMIVGFLAVFGVIAYRLSSGSTERTRTPEATLQLPAGARIVSTAAGEGRLLVTIDVAGATEVRIFDLNTLEPRGRLRLAPQP